jgi:DNA-binding helix-hairpin-helix protein with protein kinase domain
MTSPTDAGAGMPSEESIAREFDPYLFRPDFDETEMLDDGRSAGVARRQALNSARAVLALIRTAFEAKEREIEQAMEEADENARRETLWRDQLRKEEARALSAEAKLREANMQALSDEGQMRELQVKLAQAVEALSPFAEAAAFFDHVKVETKHIMTREEGAGRHYSDMFTVGDLRRARTASARGEKTHG